MFNEPFTAELTVERYLSGKRIDTFLVRHFRNYTTDRMLRLLRAGQVRINGQRAEANARVYRNQRVRVRLIEPPDKLLAPEPGPLDILFEDPWMMIVNKPAGQIVHPVGGYQGMTLANRLQAHLDGQTSHRGILRPGIVHRLDRFTSGVIAIAKEHLAHRRLSIQFQNRTPEKTYLALVEGVVPEDRGTIDLPIGRQPDCRLTLMSAAPDAIDAKPARTEFRVVERFAEHTLVAARPKTGRLHQIRIHLAQIGFPVVDDEFYARFGTIKASVDASESDRAATSLETPLCGRHALHALRILLTHPVTEQPLRVTAPLPADMLGVIKGLRYRVAAAPEVG